MRHSTIYLIATACGLVLMAGLPLHAHYARKHDQAGHEQRRGLMKELQLTDLCLVTEARYTRHPAMADLHAPLQEHPLALEHFPSGALITPPPMLLRLHDTSR